MRKTESPTGTAEELQQFLRRSEHASDDLSSEFQQAITQDPNIRDVLKLQMQAKKDLEQLHVVVRTLKRSLLLSNCILILIVVSGAAGIAVLYSRWPDSTLANTQVATSGEANASVDSKGSQDDSMSEIPLVATRKPLSPGDEAIYPLILDLYVQARQFQRSLGDSSVSQQAEGSDRYIRFLSDATKLAERAAKENVSQDLMLALLKITQLAKEHHQHLGAPAMETELLDDEIRAILRDYSPRGELFDRRRM